MRIEKKKENGTRAKSVSMAGLGFYALVAFFGFQSVAHAQNNQQVIVKGAAVNVAGPGGHAVMNISSTKNISQIRGNSQTAVINGAVVNAATFGAYSELNIASRNGGAGSGNQVVSIGGPVVSQASGMGVRNVVNIGGK